MQPDEIQQWLRFAERVEIAKKGNAQALIDWFDNSSKSGIAWGKPGDFEDCMTIASDHMDSSEAAGWCQNRHIDATGYPTGHAPGEKYGNTKKSADEEITKGDLPGHDFHGNQYAAAQEASDRAGEQSKDLGSSWTHSDFGQTYNAGDIADVHETAALFHEQAANILRGVRDTETNPGLKFKFNEAANAHDMAANFHNAAADVATTMGQSDADREAASTKASDLSDRAVQLTNDAISAATSVQKYDPAGHAFNGNQYVTQSNGHYMMARDHNAKAERFPAGSRLANAHLNAANAHLRASNAATDAANGEEGAAERFAERADEARVASAKANLLSGALVSKSSTSMVDYDDGYENFETKHPAHWGYLDDGKHRLKVRLVPHVAPEDLLLNGDPERDPANQLPKQPDNAVVEIDI